MGEASDDANWRRCSSCKQPIGFDATYWTCSVSTCNRKRTGLVFCKVSCWDAHLPIARHRESWAEEQKAPSAGEVAASRDDSGAKKTGGKRRLVRPATTETAKPAASDEVLVIASRLKDYVRAQSGYNTSDRVLGPLSDLVRRTVDEAIRNAQREGRRTVLDRDLPNS
ncbi:MAG: hypothetical protein AAF430_15370 [Myxococcota bacterium]